MNIGIIGAAGGMGQPYTRLWAELGHHLNVSDINLDKLQQAFSGVQNVTIRENNLEVALNSDFLVYSTTPLSSVDKVIRESVIAAKPGAIVGGFTSVKWREVGAFIKYAPPGVHVITIHPMHGPKTPPRNNVCPIIPVAAGEDAVKSIEALLISTGLKVPYLTSAEQHDKLTADTQVITHFSGFAAAAAYAALRHRYNTTPFSLPRNQLRSWEIWIGMRFLAQNLDVYAGIATQNPEAARPIDEFVGAVKFLSGSARKSQNQRHALSYIRVPGRMIGRDLIGRENIETAEKTFEEIIGESLDMNSQHSNIGLQARGWAWMTCGVVPSDNFVFKTPPYEITLLMTLSALGKMFDTSVNIMASNQQARAYDRAFVNAAKKLSRARKQGEAPYKAHLEQLRDAFTKDELGYAVEVTESSIGRLSTLEYQITEPYRMTHVGL
ncbi:prephenate dehydrogenase [Candidatus Woesearchaeota archaeon]|nr:prephenate dehydrogenase [Candidatus Woesearchaeota archaeon]